MTLRLFTAIRVPETLKDRLVQLQAGVPDAKWVRPENFHITLSFLGDVTEDRLADLTALLSEDLPAPFLLTLTGAGSFGSKRPRAIWAGLAPSEPLSVLQSKLASRLQRGGFPLEARRYSPHVTLAYLKGTKADDPRLQSWLGGNALFQAGPFEVDHFSLVESRLGSEGPLYTDLAEFPLSGPNT